jgi:hypothetical protein
MTDKQKLYAGNVGWEARLDADAKAKRLADYISDHVQCAKHHHYGKELNACPTCKSCVPFLVSDFPEASCS